MNTYSQSYVQLRDLLSLSALLFCFSLAVIALTIIKITGGFDHLRRDPFQRLASSGGVMIFMSVIASWMVLLGILSVYSLNDIAVVLYDVRQEKFIAGWGITIGLVCQVFAPLVVAALLLYGRRKRIERTESV